MADLEQGLAIHELDTVSSLSGDSWVAVDDGINTKKAKIADLNTASAESARDYAENAASSASAAASSAVQAQTAAQSIQSSIITATSQLQGYVDEAANSARSAANSEATIRTLITSDYAKTAKSYAVGDTGYRENENTDNAAYYCREAQGSAESASTSANTATSAASDVARISAEAEALMAETRVYLTQVTFTVDFTAGNLMYNPTEAYDFTINTATGNLEWEVTA